MKKIYLKCFIHKNFGDDLLLSIFLNRYSKYNFVSYTTTKYENPICSNIKIYDNIIFRIIDKIIRIISNEKKNLEMILIKKYGCCVVVGGSMFIENQLEKFNNIYFGNNNFSIIGSNFGPYITNNYLQKIKTTFKKADLIYFRDNSSYKLFNNLLNVRLGNDLVFGIEKNKYLCNEKKQVFISVINCEEKVKNVKDLQKKYVLEIIRTIETFIDNNYNVVLASFCKKENDEKTIDEIVKFLNNKSINHGVEIIRYKGNPEPIIKKISESEYVIGSRFHACILAIIFEKKLIPLSYNNKTIDFLKTVKFDGKIFDLTKNMNFSKYDYKTLKRFKIDKTYYQILEKELDDFEIILSKYANR